MNEPIRYCITIDTEEEWDWNTGYPTGPTRVQNIQQLPRFQQLANTYGAAVVYFTNYAVLADPQSRQIIQDLAREPRTEIGLHIHPWNTPPLDPEATVSERNSYLHNLPWPEAKAKLDSVLAAFASANLKPTSYRGGRYSSSPQIQHYLRELGLGVDCSVLPYISWKDDGAPDFRNRDATPQRHEHHGQPIWELPLTLGPTRLPVSRWMNILRLAKSKVGRTLRITGILERLGIVSQVWLNLENPDAGDIVKYLGVLRKLRPPFVSFTLHSSSLLQCGSPYVPTQAHVDRIYERTESMLKLLNSWPEFAPATMTEIAQHLENAHAHHRNESTR